jgi:hypothetical protein
MFAHIEPSGLFARAKTPDAGTGRFFENIDSTLLSCLKRELASFDVRVDQVLAIETNLFKVTAPPLPGFRDLLL